jgi:hypothetical protein
MAMHHIQQLGITQKSSWFMGHRIRKACKNNNAILSGIIEMDETYIGVETFLIVQMC